MHKYLHDKHLIKLFMQQVMKFRAYQILGSAISRIIWRRTVARNFLLGLNFGFKLFIYSHVRLLFVCVNYEGIMNWAQMIHPMLQSSMIAVGLRTLRHLAALHTSMSLMMKTDVATHTLYLALDNLLPC